MKLRMAVQLFTLRDYLKTPQDMKQTLAKVKEIGYNAVQVSGIGPIDHETFKQLADEAGLDICATHVRYDDLLHRMDDVIQQHKIWDCKYVGIGSMPLEQRQSEEGYVSFAKEASEVADKLQAAGLQFIYHNHGFEFTRFGTRTGMEILLEEASPSFGFELDVYWAQFGGADVIDWIHKLKGRMQVVHLKDLRMMPDGQQQFSEVGEGSMNFKGILQACEEIGVEWGAVEQDSCYEKDPFECLATSFRNLKTLGVQV